MIAPPPDRRTSGAEDENPSRARALAERQTRAAGILRADPQGQCLFVNRAWCELTGIARERFLGGAWRSNVPRAELAQVGEVMETLRRGESIHTEYLAADSEGRRRWLQLEVTPELDGEGRVTGEICTLLDVTPQHEAEERRREAERRLRDQLRELETLYTLAPVGLCHVDRELRHVRVNPIWAEIVGARVDDLVGHSLEKVGHPVAREITSITRRTLETGTAVSGVEIRDAGPTEQVWLANAHPLHSKERVIGTVAVLQDVTALKQIQRDLERSQQLAGVGSWWWNLLDDTGWWSDELYRIMDRDPRQERPSYDGFFEMVHPEDRPSLRAHIERALATGQPVAASYRILRPDGSARRIHSVALVERSPEGLPLRMSGVIRAATETDA